MLRGLTGKCGQEAHARRGAALQMNPNTRVIIRNPLGNSEMQIPTMRSDHHRAAFFFQCVVNVFHQAVRWTIIAACELDHCCAPLAAVLRSHALAYPGPLPGTEDISKLMVDSALVCKGEILEAPEVKFVSDPELLRDTAIAIVHMDLVLQRRAAGKRNGASVVRQHAAIIGRWTVCGASEGRLQLVLS